MNNIPFTKQDGEVALWATQRKQLPSGQWVITVWLDTDRDDLSNAVHKEVATTVKHMMSLVVLKTVLIRRGNEMKIVFEEVKSWGQRTIVVDGKKKRQSKTFMQTINPFNKNLDGTVKTYGEVLKSVENERDKWVSDNSSNKKEKV